jgi:hypothetical protein
MYRVRDVHQWISLLELLGLQLAGLSLADQIRHFRDLIDLDQDNITNCGGQRGGSCADDIDIDRYQESVDISSAIHHGHQPPFNATSQPARGENPNRIEP